MLICTTRLAFPSSVLQDRPTACSRHLPDLRGLLTRVSHNRRLISSPAPPNPNAPASAWVACLPGASRPAAPFPWSNPSQARPGGVDETALRTAQEYVKPPAVPPYRYAQAENPGLCPWRSGVHPPPLLSRRHPEKPQPLTIPLEKEGLGLRLVVAACVTGHGCPSAEPARRRPQRTLHPMFRKRQKKKKGILSLDMLRQRPDGSARGGSAQSPLGRALVTLASWWLLVTTALLIPMEVSIVSRI